jgi:hypothetical protein
MMRTALAGGQSPACAAPGVDSPTTRKRTGAARVAGLDLAAAHREAVHGGPVEGGRVAIDAHAGGEHAPARRFERNFLGAERLHPGFDALPRLANLDPVVHGVSPPRTVTSCNRARAW